MYLIDHSYNSYSGPHYVYLDKNSLNITKVPDDKLPYKNIREDDGILRRTVESCGDFFSEKGLFLSSFSFSVFDEDGVRSLMYEKKLYKFAEHQIEFKLCKSFLFDTFNILVDDVEVAKYKYFVPFWRAWLQSDSMTLDFIYPLRYAVEIMKTEA